MKSLIIKDFLLLKDQIKIFLLMMVFFLIFSTATKNSSMFGIMITLFSVMMIITTFAYDEKISWDKYALSMPISRIDIVLEKYILGLIFTISGVLISFVFNMIITGNLQENTTMILFGFSIGILFLSIILPFSFKFGIEKGRLIMMIVIFVLTSLSGVLLYIGFQMPSMEILMKLLYFAPFISLIIFAISAIISIGIYKNKEL